MDHPSIKPPAGCKHLSLIQMVLLTHLKAGFEKGYTAVVIVMVTGSAQCKQSNRAARRLLLRSYC